MPWAGNKTLHLVCTRPIIDMPSLLKYCVDYNTTAAAKVTNDTDTDDGYSLSGLFNEYEYYDSPGKETTYHRYLY